MNNLCHGSDSKLIKFSNPTFFFIGDVAAEANSYGKYVYDCSANVHNTLDLSEADDLQRTSSGIGISGSSKKTEDIIRKLMKGFSEADINNGIQLYNKKGFSLSPARIFNGKWNEVIKNAIEIG